VDSECLRKPDVTPKRPEYFGGNFNQQQTRDFNHWKNIEYEHGHSVACGYYIGKEQVYRETFDRRNFTPQHRNTNNGKISIAGLF
jgi:DNA/RNA endonuclease G (NUC1)